MPKTFEELVSEHQEKHFSDLKTKVENIFTNDPNSLNDMLLLTFNEATRTSYSLIATYHSWLLDNFQLIPKEK